MNRPSHGALLATRPHFGRETGRRERTELTGRPPRNVSQARNRDFADQPHVRINGVIHFLTISNLASMISSRRVVIAQDREAGGPLAIGWFVGRSEISFANAIHKANTASVTLLIAFSLSFSRLFWRIVISASCPSGTHYCCSQPEPPFHLLA